MKMYIKKILSLVVLVAVFFTVFSAAGFEIIMRGMSTAAAAINISGTPANHQWAIWTDSSTLKGLGVTGSKVVCTGSTGEPVACTNLTDIAAAAKDGSNWTLASQAIGDLLYASSTTAYTRLADVAAGQPLLSGGTGTAPAYAGYTFSATAGQTYTFPGGSPTLASLAGTETFTNKRITKRIQTAADATSITPTGDSADVVIQTNTQSAGTLTINNPTGTPTDGQMLLFRIKCGTGVQTYSFDTLYRGSTTTALPTACTASKTDHFLAVYNYTDTKWEIIAYDTGR